LPDLPEQSQLGSVPLKIPFITAAAQPTPDLTLNALTGQFRTQAPLLKKSGAQSGNGITSGFKRSAERVTARAET